MNRRVLSHVSATGVPVLQVPLLPRKFSTHMVQYLMIGPKTFEEVMERFQGDAYRVREEVKLENWGWMGHRKIIAFNLLSGEHFGSIL